MDRRAPDWRDDDYVIPAGFQALSKGGPRQFQTLVEEIANHEGPFPRDKLVRYLTVNAIRNLARAKTHSERKDWSYSIHNLIRLEMRIRQEEAVGALAVDAEDATDAELVDPVMLEARKRIEDAAS